MSILLLILYPLAIQVERGKLWYIVAPLTTLTALIDIVANHTELAIIYGWPKSGEWTFSQRLKRLSYLADWRGDLARWCIWYTNYFDPQGDHVK